MFSAVSGMAWQWHQLKIQFRHVIGTAAKSVNCICQMHTRNLHTHTRCMHLRSHKFWYYSGHKFKPDQN